MFISEGRLADSYQQEIRLLNPDLAIHAGISLYLANVLHGTQTILNPHH